MLPASGVYPRENPRPTGSRAEVRVYQALRAKLPPGWYAWHSLRVQTREGWCGEGDFVIAEPRRGLLVLEVKGGAVELRDGLWWQNAQLMKPTPREQAFRFETLLLARLADGQCEPPAYGVATCFPDVGAPRSSDPCLPSLRLSRSLPADEAPARQAARCQGRAD